jgi:transcriptional regulator with XRE-family HTH domain
MTEGDPVATLREFRDYIAVTYEANHKIAARIGVTQWTVRAWLAGKSYPKAKSLAKLQAFLDAEARRPAQGDGIRSIERVPLKIVLPPRQLHYARLCPFCRKARGKIRKLRAASFHGVCPKCGATGSRRQGHQDALRSWNGRG